MQLVQQSTNLICSQTKQNQITWHDSSDHKLDEVDFDSFVLLADELEEALSVGRINAVFVETRRCHDAAGIVHAAPDCDLAAAEQLPEGVEIERN